jgi:predicted DNA binding CopG/RHH family protein
MIDNSIKIEYNIHMERINLYVSENQLKELKELKKTTGITWSEHIRRAIDEYLAKQKTTK